MTLSPKNTEPSAAREFAVLPLKRHSNNIWRSLSLISLGDRIGVIFGLLFSSVFELLGIAIIVPLFAMIGTNVESHIGLKGQVRKIAVDIFGAFGMEFNFINLTATILLLLALKTIVIIAVMRRVGILTNKINSSFQMRLVQGFLHADDAFATELQTKRIAKATTTTSLSLGSGFRLICDFYSSIFQLLVYAAVCIVISRPMAALAAFTASVMFVSYKVLSYHSNKKKLKTANTKPLSPNLIHGIRTLKVMGRQKNSSTLIRNLVQSMRRTIPFNLKIDEVTNELQEPLIALTLGFGIYFGATVLKLDFSHQFFVVMILIRLVGTLKKLQRDIHHIAKAAPRYRIIMDLIGKIEGGEEKKKKKPDTQVPDPAQGIEFRGATITGRNGTTMLKDMNFKINPGEIVVLAGKTAKNQAILETIIGLKMPESGDILLGGLSSAIVDGPSWRRSIGYVPKDTALFDGSILENVTLGDPDYKEADATAILAALSAGNYINAQALKLHRTVHERPRIRGTHKKRIGLARALISKPKFLLLEEPTMSLRPQARRLICAFIERRARESGMTVICATNDQEWFAIADKFLILRKRRIVIKTGAEMRKTVAKVDDSPSPETLEAKNTNFAS